MGSACYRPRKPLPFLLCGQVHGSRIPDPDLIPDNHSFAQTIPLFIVLQLPSLCHKSLQGIRFPHYSHEMCVCRCSYFCVPHERSCVRVVQNKPISPQDSFSFLRLAPDTIVMRVMPLGDVGSEGSLKLGRPVIVVVPTWGPSDGRLLFVTEHRVGDEFALSDLSAFPLGISKCRPWV